MTNLSEKLEQLSAAASEVGLSMPGEPAWPIEQSRKINAERDLRNMLFAAYRTGQLVAVQADDATVDRVKDALWLRLDTHKEHEVRELAELAIAAMKGDA